MKYIHITHNRSIVNATDDTSDTLIRARTLAPPVCTAADSPTADSGRGMMSARRSNQGRWCSVAILIAFAATLFVCGTASAATQTIDGDPVDVSVYGGGRIVPYYDNWANKYQYFGTTACNNVLWLNGTSMGFDAPNGSNCGAPLFTPVSNSKPDPWTIETVYDAGDTGVRITQRIEYINGNRYYTMNWSIANNGAPTYSDLRFIHGGDTYFGGQDSANGNYDSGLNMVYLTNSGVTGIMGLLGTPTSPMDHHQAGQYGTVTSSMCAGRLSDIVDPSFTDAGYAAEWDQATLAPGDVWEIVAIEKWTAAGDVQVFSPAGQSGYVGDTFDYSFTVQNLQSSSDTFDLSTSSSQGWAVSLPGGGTVTIGASSSETVLVQVAVTSEGTDVTTLTVTSQSDSSVTNDDSVTTQAATSHLCTCGDICVNQDCWWHDGGSFNQSTTPIQHAINNSTAGNTIYVAGGDYTENVNVNKQVTLRGEGADVVNVTAESAGDHVFDVQQDYVNISGFNVTGATGDGKAGICLSGSQHCNVSNNTASNNSNGIYLYSSSNNTLTNNNANSNTHGILLLSSSSNTIYNNYFNNTPNAHDDGNNTWNTTPATGTNIIGGSHLGGNYWSDYAGADTTGDGLGDTLTPYNSSDTIQNGGDYHPLTTYPPIDHFNVTGITDPVAVWGTTSPVVTAYDEYDNVKTNYVGTIHFTSTDGSAVLPGDYTFVEGDNGAHTFTNEVILKTFGEQNVTVTGDAKTGSQTGITVTPAAIDYFIVTGITDPVVAGVPTSPVVTAYDEYDNVKTDYTGTINFSSTDGNATLPADYTFNETDNGTKTFTNEAILKTIGERSVTVTGDAKTGSQTGITVTIAAMDHFNVAGITDPVAVWETTSPIVTACDAYNNVETDYVGTINFSSTDGNATLPGTYEFEEADSGTKTFANEVILKTVGEQNVTVTGADYKTGSQTGITVTSAAMDHLIVAGITDPITSATTSGVNVTAKDQYGNIASSYAGAIHFTTTDYSSDALLPDDYTFETEDEGAKAFDGVTAGQVVKLVTISEQTVTATDTVKSTATGSQTVTVQSSAVTSYDIDLVPGWNLISTPLIPDNSSIEAVLSGMTNVEGVYAYDALNATWMQYTPGVTQYADLTHITAERGYWFRMNASETLTINGSFLGPGGTTPPAYQVYTAWNLIGFHSLSADIPYDYLSNVRDDYASEMYGYKNGLWTTVHNSDVVNGTDNLKPGYGYWLYMQQNGTITP